MHANRCQPVLPSKGVGSRKQTVYTGWPSAFVALKCVRSNKYSEHFFPRRRTTVVPKAFVQARFSNNGVPSDA
eukprot:1728388-Alexandrium_andersonii.AAC.1